jgi:hypothetical protein
MIQLKINTHENEQKTLVAKIRFILHAYRQAVDDDVVLLSLYRVHYGATTDMEDTIKRYGRLIRAKDGLRKSAKREYECRQMENVLSRRFAVGYSE